MIINHNLSALNTYRNAQQNSQAVNKSTGKLSSGMRINQAADDSAGLAISEKMRGQIRGLQKAQSNISDGISLVQVAEGGMAEIQDILQRIRELAVNSANDTNTEEDRIFIQTEVSQLLEEIEGIANKTEFNGMQLLAGNLAKDGQPGVSNFLAQHVQSVTNTHGITETYSFNGKNYPAASIDFSNLTTPDEVAKLDGTGVHYTCPTCSIAYSIKFVDGNPDTSRLNSLHPVMEVDISSASNGQDLVELIKMTAYGEGNFTFDPEASNLTSNATSFAKHYSKLASDGSKLIIFDDRSYIHGQKFPTSDGRGVFQPSVYGEIKREPEQFFKLKIQAGSNEGQHLQLDIPNVTSSVLGVDRLLVNTRGNANTAISQIDYAINRVSDARATVGVYQNRLEYAFTNAAKYEENLTSSESRIRDADIAKEITNLTGHQILLQSSQAMLVQANQITQAILQLLK